MKTTLQASHDTDVIVRSQGTVWISIKILKSDSTHLEAEVNADELLQAVKAHHALTKTK